jgi:hypothetical protein
LLAGPFSLGYDFVADVVLFPVAVLYVSTKSLLSSVDASHVVIDGRFVAAPFLDAVL